MADCLASVAGQTWPHSQHVVVDGVSTDVTLEVLQAHRQQLAVLQSEPDRGIYDALNNGLALATGNVVGFLQANGLYAHPQVLQRVAQAFADPAVCAVYGDLEYVRQHDTTQLVRHWHSSLATPNRLASGWIPPHPTLYVRCNWYQRIGSFNTQYRIAADYLSILPLFSQPGFKAVYLSQALVTVRLGGASNRSVKAVLRRTSEDWRALRATRVGALGGHAGAGVSTSTPTPVTTP